MRVVMPLCALWFSQAVKATPSPVTPAADERQHFQDHAKKYIWPNRGKRAAGRGGRFTALPPPPAGATLEP